MTSAILRSAQATLLTGSLPREHGIVANGWYWRDLSEVLFWRQSNQLVQSEKIWQAARKRNPDFTCANSFWWFNMNTDVDWAVTPRPLYCADGRKLPDCYSIPSQLRDDFNREFGQFPLNDFFWRQMPKLKTPAQYTAVMAMTFEAANLDFAQYYSKIFRSFGDHKTADILDIVLEDEISHVAFGAHWMKRWSDSRICSSRAQNWKKSKANFARRKPTRGNCAG